MAERRPKPEEAGTPSGGRVAGARRRRLLLGLLLVVVLAVVLIIIDKPWLPLRYGRAQPPAVATEGLEPPLARLIAERTAAVRADPYAAEAWGRLGIVYDVHDMPREAIACYERAQRLDPAEFRWPYFLALCELPTDHGAARAELLAARAIRDDYAPLELHLARSYFDAGDLERAKTHFVRASTLDGALVRPHIGLARIALARDDPETALRHLEDALARRPKSGEVHFLLAETYRRLGKETLAREHAEQAGDRAAFEEFSDQVRMESQWEVGVTMFWRATRSRAYLESGMIDRAIAEWVAVLEDDPGSTRAWTELGRIYTRANDPERAMEAYGRALAIDPTLHAIRHELGLLLVRSGRTEAGLPLVRESCEALPDRPDLRSNLGRVLARAGKPDEAAGAFRRAAAQYAASGRYERARTAYQSALGQVAGDPVASVELAWLLATCPDPDERDPARAQELIESLTASRAPTVRMRDTLAAALAAQGDFAAAITTAERALSEASDLPTGERDAIAARLDGYRAGRAFVEE